MSVDLSLAKRGDECHLRNGEAFLFEGPNESMFAGEHVYRARYSFRGDGTCHAYPGVTDWPYDIVRVTRNGVQVTPGIDCGCETCWEEAHKDETFPMRHMIVCPTCGNKRCPKATHHANACTNSNETGQPGSSWENVKPVGTPTTEDAVLPKFAFLPNGEWVFANYPGQLPPTVREAQERAGYTKKRPAMPDSPRLTVAEKAAVLDWMLSSPRKDAAQAFTDGDQRCLADLLDCRYAERSTVGQLNMATQKVNAILGIS